MPAKNRLATGNPTTRVVVGSGQRRARLRQDAPQRRRARGRSWPCGASVCALNLGLVPIPMSRSGFVLPDGLHERQRRPRLAGCRALASDGEWAAGRARRARAAAGRGAREGGRWTRRPQWAARRPDATWHRQLSTPAHRHRAAARRHGRRRLRAEVVSTRRAPADRGGRRRAVEAIVEFVRHD